MKDPTLYEGREQTLVKHLILSRYLERFAIIIGFNWTSITYIDCFSGPWKSRSEQLRDTSFSIALTELRKAREVHLKRSKSIVLRAFFLEKLLSAYSQLKQFSNEITDVEIMTHNGELETSVTRILNFIKQDSKTFPFIFIDPTGWTGFAMQDIGPLLRLKPGEVLINFITGHIERFIESPQEQTRESFIRLFGSDQFKPVLEGLQRKDREDAIVAEYCETVKRTGRFKHVAPAIVLHPQKDRTHFHLIYATHNDTGLEVFKDAEKRAMTEMEHARAEAQKRRRERKSGQSELFGSDEMYNPSYYESIRNRYLSRAKDIILDRLMTKTRLSYDDAWTLALSQPLTWESDLKKMIVDWRKEGLAVIGLTDRQRVPKRDCGHVLVWEAHRNSH
ncbi:MAG TPA: three-Cys-motif partner protein TcmP [Blastocatellia bacterium]|nr:three-Cys-motif partner protein TcmP [Blastocatellia bacterium]